MERSKGLNNHKLANKKGKRTEAQRVADTAYCATLFRQGHTYRHIADMLNERNAKMGLGYTIEFAQVHRDLRQQQDEWLRDIADNIALYYTQELGKLDMLEQEAMAAWERSKGERRKTKIAGGTISQETKKIQGGTVKERESMSMDGDPRYLKLVLDIMEKRDKLLERAYNSVMTRPSEAPTALAVRKELPEDLKARITAHFQGIPALPDQPPIDETAEALDSTTRYDTGPVYNGPEAEEIEAEDVTEIEAGQPVLTLDED